MPDDRRGLGIGVLPRKSVAPHVKSMGLKALKPPGMCSHRSLLLIMRNADVLSPPAQGFVKMVRERLG